MAGGFHFQPSLLLTASASKFLPPPHCLSPCAYYLTLVRTTNSTLSNFHSSLFRLLIRSNQHLTRLKSSHAFCVLSGSKGSDLAHSASLILGICSASFAIGLLLMISLRCSSSTLNAERHVACSEGCYQMYRYQTYSCNIPAYESKSLCRFEYSVLVTFPYHNYLHFSPNIDQCPVLPVSDDVDDKWHKRSLVY